MTQCKDFPDIENLYHHCWEFWKERGQDGGGNQKQRQRREEGKRVWRKRQGRRNVSGDGVSGDGTRRKKGGEKKARAKTEARFMSPRIPASFYRPRDD